MEIDCAGADFDSDCTGDDAGSDVVYVRGKCRVIKSAIGVAKFAIDFQNMQKVSKIDVMT